MHLQVYCAKILPQDYKANHSYESNENAQHEKNREENESPHVLFLNEEYIGDLFKVFKSLNLQLKIKFISTKFKFYPKP